ncbi:hypothetical protein [Shewanella sp. NIFS-20-20]|uniref:hypothetical protein n=1 Tax=Shewanella sp. NIFS-20-20 TaxID=2853806 RepID=UPI001C47DA86|nr:hypothetical protein [Shewanella sp. NIFS-20-20]MBV7316917.1 hypothetical protein [Shewanella sp. NIFS-20-20]
MSTAPLAFNVSPSLDLGALIHALAQSRTVIMHAAIYSRFVNGVVDEVLSRQLALGHLQQLVLISASAEASWHTAFEQVLRQGIRPAAMAREWHSSDRWIASLVERYPQQVQDIRSTLLPTQPMILTDTRLFIGHYAHSATAAGQGFWLECNIEQLSFDLNSSAPLSSDDPWIQAVYRHIDECRQIFASQVQSWDQELAI